jgi:DNA-binding GntR family transcriptional regulator
MLPMTNDGPSMSAQPEHQGGEREPQAEKAYRELRRLILQNELPAGMQLLEQEAALRLGMSRTPVREAMVRLQQEGMVEIRPRHGMRVLPVSVDDMRDIYALLTALESLAARLAAERGLGDEELTSLDEAVQDMDDALAREDLDSWAKADARFHRLLVSAAGNRRLENAVANLVDQSHRVRRMTLRLRPKPEASNNDHRAVVAAIRNGDSATALAIHEAHRRKNGQMLIGLLKQMDLCLV